MPTIFRNLRMLRLKASSFMVGSFRVERVNAIVVPDGRSLVRMNIPLSGGGFIPRPRSHGEPRMLSNDGNKKWGGNHRTGSCHVESHAAERDPHHHRCAPRNSAGSLAS